ncbi:MAG: hypothetical protein O7B25_03710 [Gammaproteobacteria bacterium]|nr:hypothetical protein [Gammaproteobacteria bacterium]
MCALAHFLESEGMVTIVLGLIPQHVRVMRPPRALLVPFELGRPLGPPHQAELQREVLCAALRLLSRPGPGPVLEAFESIEPINDEASEAEPWLCPVSFPAAATGDGLSDRIAQEINLLRPSFDLGYRQRGHTAADVSGIELHDLIGWLCNFLADDSSDASPIEGRSLAESFKLGVEDLKAFYVEAITVQPSSASSSDINSWFWGETAAGELLWGLREHLQEHPDEGIRLHAQLTLVPAAQVAQRQ